MPGVLGSPVTVLSPAQPPPHEFLTSVLLGWDLPRSCESSLLTLSSVLGHTCAYTCPGSNTALGDRRLGSQRPRPAPISHDSAVLMQCLQASPIPFVQSLPGSLWTYMWPSLFQHPQGLTECMYPGNTHK